MKNQTFFFVRNIFCVLFLTSIFASLLNQNPLKSNSLLLADLNDINKDKDIHSSFDESNESFFPSNPMELMKILRSFESVNDGTSPSDAIDAAIEAFENEDQAASSLDLEDN